MITATHGTKVPMIKITLGVRLAAARQEADLTQTAIATLLGVSRRTVARWESGEREPTPATIISYSMITDVNLGWIQTGVADRGDEYFECAPRDSNPEPTDSGPLALVTPIWGAAA